MPVTNEEVKKRDLPTFHSIGNSVVPVRITVLISFPKIPADDALKHSSSHLHSESDGDRGACAAVPLEDKLFRSLRKRTSNSCVRFSPSAPSRVVTMGIPADIASRSYFDTRRYTERTQIDIILIQMLLHMRDTGRSSIPCSPCSFCISRRRVPMIRVRNQDIFLAVVVEFPPDNTARCLYSENKTAYR